MIVVVGKKSWPRDLILVNNRSRDELDIQISTVSESELRVSIQHFFENGRLSFTYWNWKCSCLGTCETSISIRLYRSVVVSDRPLIPAKHPLAVLAVDTESLRSNHQISAEALDMFLKENEFEYEEDWIREQPQPSRWTEDGFNPTPRYKQKRTILCENTLKRAPKVRAKFYSNDLFADFAQLMAQNPNLTSLQVSFKYLSDGLVKNLEVALPLLDNIKVRDQVVLDCVPTIRSRPGMSKRAQKVCKTLKDLEEKMLPE